MDRTDYQILNLLQRDSRTTLKNIGDQVGLTAPAVSERIRRMEEKGVIKGFSINIDRTLLDCNLTGYILVAVFPEKYSQFCKFCEDTPAITTWWASSTPCCVSPWRTPGSWTPCWPPSSSTATLRPQWSCRSALRRRTCPCRNKNIGSNKSRPALQQSGPAFHSLFFRTVR